MKHFVRHMKESDESKFDSFVEELSDAWDVADTEHIATGAGLNPISNGTKRTPAYASCLTSDACRQLADFTYFPR